MNGLQPLYFDVCQMNFYTLNKEEGGVFIKQVTFNLGIEEGHNLALRKLTIAGGGNTCTEKNNVPTQCM